MKRSLEQSSMRYPASMLQPSTLEPSEHVLTTGFLCASELRVARLSILSLPGMQAQLGRLLLWLTSVGRLHTGFKVNRPGASSLGMFATSVPYAQEA